MEITRYIHIDGFPARDCADDATAATRGGRTKSDGFLALVMATSSSQIGPPGPWRRKGRARNTDSPARRRASRIPARRVWLLSAGGVAAAGGRPEMAANGIQSPPDEIHPTRDGIQCPPGEIHPTGHGIHPMRDGIQCPPAETHPTQHGIHPMRNGIQCPPAETHPMRHAIHPMRDRIHPIREGMNPSIRHWIVRSRRTRASPPTNTARRTCSIPPCRACRRVPPHSYPASQR